MHRVNSTQYARKIQMSFDLYIYTVSQFLFATISFHNLSEINWFAVTYFHNQHVDYPENKVPEII